MRRSGFRVLALCMGLMAAASASSASFAQDVFPNTDPSVTLNQRFLWAHDRAKSERSGTYWIAYSIQRQMKEDSWMGHFGADWRNNPTLSEILTGRIPDRSLSIRDAAKEALDRANRIRSERLVEKEIVMLLQFTGRELIEINQSNIELAYDFEGQDVFWLGPALNTESIPLLIDAYDRTTNSDLKEDLVTAVAVHDDPDQTKPFVVGVIESDAHKDIRENAVFWMSRFETTETVRYLERLAETDRSGDVRENAVFALSRIRMDEALDGLIRLARRANDEDVQEKARFWLGQRASNELLGDVDEDDDESKLQKQAVFALSQMDNDDGVDELIELAHSHSSPVVRKQAIFWLGQTDSDRALEAIIEMLKAGS